MDGCRFLAGLSPEKGRVLMFHDIGNDSGELNIDINLFERILQKTNGMEYNVLKYWELAKNKFVALTFDDVMESFFTNGYPLLKKYNYPFTIFVNLSLLDTPGFITTNNLKELASDPLCTVGSHGMNHGYFANFSDEEALKDMKESQEKLQLLTGKAVELFAFPYGSVAAVGWGKHKLVRQVYRYGFSTVNSPIAKHNPLPLGFLPRMNVDNNTIKNLDL